jgi:hypothetical protein
MSRPVIYRTLSEPWLLILQAELTVRLEAEALRGVDWRSESAENHWDAATELGRAADKLHALWQIHEQETTGEDLMFAEMTAAMVAGDAPLDDVLLEAGVWIICGKGGGFFVRFEIPLAVPEAPELVFLDEAIRL